MQNAKTTQLVLILLGVVFLVCTNAAQAKEAEPLSIPVDNQLGPLRYRGRPDYRKLIKKAGTLLKSVRIDLAGVRLDGKRLRKLADSNPKEPFLRVVRESLGRAIDLHDFVLFLDDVILAQKKLRKKVLWLPPGRARKVGILVHPDDVFLKHRPRKYPHGKKTLKVDRPKRLPELKPAKNGDPLGPNWAARYHNPSGKTNKLMALIQNNVYSTFAERIESLMEQLESQGCIVGLYTTVRNRKRGYLMWGAFRLSHLTSRREVLNAARDLKKLNKEWKLYIPIRWYHPRGWKATIEAARQMADAYDVVYATKTGAKKSRHYGGDAVDLVAIGLPRRLELTGFDGVSQVFVLSHPEQTRDLSLTPLLIDWIEKHFYMKKLLLDYPHWDDMLVGKESPKTRPPADKELFQ